MTTEEVPATTIKEIPLEEPLPDEVEDGDAGAGDEEEKEEEAGG